MKKVIMCLIAVSLIFTNISAIQAKDTKENSEQKTINEEATENEGFELSNEFADLASPEFRTTEKQEFLFENSMTEKAYNEFSSTSSIQIETGENFTLMLKENGTVWAWGNNQYGQLGNGTTEYSGIPQKISELTNIVYINAGSTFAFAINNNGEVFGWGNNRYAQLGDGTCTQRNKPVRISKLTDVKKVSSGYYHSVALKNDGTVYFWGSPIMRDSAHSSQFELYPIKIDIPIIKDISSGKSHIIALSEDGEIYTWGENESGQLGNGVVGNRVISPQKVELSANITKIESGMNHSMVLDDSGNVYAWGNNLYGQLGDGTNEDKCTPIMLESINNIKDVIAGYNHTIFIKNNDGIYICGNNEYGQLGVGTTENSNLPIKISNQYESVLISGGLSHTIENNAKGNIYVWGLNSSRQLGNGYNTPNNSVAEPTEVYGLENIVSIECGIYHSLALDNDGTVWSWGYNSHSQLGDGTTINRDEPKKVIDDVQSVSAGYYHSLALKKDGTVWAWGFNGFNQIGQRESKNYSPVQVPNLTEIKAIAAGAYHNLALKKDGTVWMWGRRDYNNYISINSLTQVKGLSDIKTIAVGYYSNFAIKDDGTVYAWGINNAGQLGDGTAVNTETPVKLNINNIKAIAAGTYHTIMLDNNSIVSGFGDNGYYQYGNIDKRVFNNIQAVAAGQYHSLLLTENGRVLACGDNKYGQLGNGTNRRNITPVEIDGLKDIKDIAAGYGYSMALKRDGHVMAWGNDGSGQLGTGQKFTLKNPCLFGTFENAKQIEFGESASGSIEHISGQEWYKITVPYNLSYKFSVTQGYEIEVYRNNALQGRHDEFSVELKNTDEVYIKVIRKNNEYNNYTLNISSNNIIDTKHKKHLVIVNGSEYYSNLYDNGYLYKDDVRLTNYPVISICTNGNDVFVSGDYNIFRVDGTTLTRIVSGVKADFIAADSKTIYFSEWYTGGKIYYSKIGSNRYSHLSDDAGIFLELDDTYLYYYDVKNHCKRTKINKIQ